MATKALVQVGIHSRVVRFDDSQALYLNIRAAFSDVSQVGAPNTKLLVQGKFVDLREHQNISNRSVLNVIVTKIFKLKRFLIFLEVLHMTLYIATFMIRASNTVVCQGSTICDVFSEGSTTSSPVMRR